MSRDIIGSPAWCEATRRDIEEMGFHHPDYLGTQSTLALIARIEALEAVAAADLALIAELDAWLNDASSLRHDATRALHAAEARFHEARAAAGLP